MRPSLLVAALLIGAPTIGYAQDMSPGQWGAVAMMRCAAEPEIESYNVAGKALECSGQAVSECSMRGGEDESCTTEVYQFAYEIVKEAVETSPGFRGSAPFQGETDQTGIACDYFAGETRYQREFCETTLLLMTYFYLVEKDGVPDYVQQLLANMPE